MAQRLTRGVFITLEGGDGAGKSTQARAIVERLRAVGRAVCITEEPGGTALGHSVRKFLEEQVRAETPLAPQAELFLFEAARAQHVAEVIRPALERGEVVVCDRFADSTIAYQGYGRGMDMKQIETCNAIATGGLRPDLTLLLDVPPGEGLVRAAGADAKRVDSIGSAPLDFHDRVRAGFLELARREPERFLVLDATLPRERVTSLALKRIQAFLQRD